MAKKKAHEEKSRTANYRAVQPQKRSGYAKRIKGHFWSDV